MFYMLNANPLAILNFNKTYAYPTTNLSYTSTSKKKKMK